MHPGAWWAWSLALATAATRTTNPIVLLLLVAVAGFTVSARRSPHSSRSFALFVRLGLVVLVVRVVFDIVFGAQPTGDVLLRVPTVPLPGWAAGLHLGGNITVQGLLTAVYGGLQLATLLICVGSANALASPRRLLRAMPGALYEAGVAITVAMSFAPQLAAAAVRVRRARRLRGRPSSGVRSWLGIALPVLEDALGALDRTRGRDGFARVRPARGRVGDPSPLVSAAVVAGLVAVAIAVYELLDATSPTSIGLPLLVLGTAIACGAVLVRGSPTNPDEVPAGFVARVGVDRGHVRRCGARRHARRGSSVPGVAAHDDVPTRRPAGAMAGHDRPLLALDPGVGHVAANPCPARVFHATATDQRLPRTSRSRPMIRFESVTVTYPDAETPAIRDVELSIPEGELVLVIGRTGAGKSTLLKAINGLVPHFTGGTLAGRVTVDGRDTRSYPPRELADVVGYVGQDPLAGFVTDSVEEELAYAMESLGVSPAVMRRRVEDILDSLGLTGLRQRPLRTLSSGEQQRVAIGSVLTAGARVLVLDEPTSALDPPAADDVLAALTRLVHDLGVTVVAAEHRLERVIQYADRVIHVDETVAYMTQRRVSPWRAARSRRRSSSWVGSCNGRRCHCRYATRGDQPTPCVRSWPRCPHRNSGSRRSASPSSRCARCRRTTTTSSRYAASTCSYARARSSR